MHRCIIYRRLNNKTAVIANIKYLLIAFVIYNFTSQYDYTKLLSWVIVHLDGLNALTLRKPPCQLNFTDRCKLKIIIETLMHLVKVI